MRETILNDQVRKGGLDGFSNEDSRLITFSTIQNGRIIGIGVLSSGKSNVLVEGDGGSKSEMALKYQKIVGLGDFESVGNGKTGLCRTAAASDINSGNRVDENFLSRSRKGKGEENGKEKERSEHY